jgi:hypothetical protein
LITTTIFIRISTFSDEQHPRPLKNRQSLRELLKDAHSKVGEYHNDIRILLHLKSTTAQPKNQSHQTALTKLFTEENPANGSLLSRINYARSTQTTLGRWLISQGIRTSSALSRCSRLRYSQAARSTNTKLGSM